MTPYRRALAERSVRRLMSSQVLNDVGDQAATIAISVLAFRDGHSAVLSALPFALLFLPSLLGLGLGGLADALDRRKLMIALDAAQATLMVVIATGALPLAGTLAAFGLLGLARIPYQAARSALLADLCSGETYVEAVGLGRLLNGITVALGFAFGGVLVALSGPRLAVAVDAGSFIAAAGLLVAVADSRKPARRFLHAPLREGLAAVWQDDLRRRLLLLVLAGTACFMAPEAVAVPTAAHRAAWVAGLLTSSVPAGLVIGTLSLGMLGSRARHPAIAPALAIGGALALIATVGTDSVWLTATLWFLAGAAGSYLVLVITAFNLATPAELRGRANALAAALVASAQGLVFLSAGLLAAASGRPRVATACIGAVSLVAVVAVTLSLRKSSRFVVPLENLATSERAEAPVAT